MKKSSWLKLTGINILVVIAIILPFFPGPSNSIIIVLSAVAQFMSILGYVLVPAGIIWCIIAIKRRKPVQKFITVPLFLVIIPLVSLFTRIYIAEPLSNYSRKAAIQKSEKVITAIEEYKTIYGQYPGSLRELETRTGTKLPGPGIMGIKNFRYNHINGHYSLSFSQWLDFGSLEELVLYDKNNLRNNLTGPYADYDYKFDLCRVQGASAVHETGQDHWKYFLLD